jgi:hypothetical protein
MPHRALLLGPTLAATLYAALGCNRSPMDNPLAPTRDDLEHAYRTHDPILAGHQSAEAVAVAGDAITVLCSANPRGEGDHTWLIGLDSSGTVIWERHYSPDQGVGRALAALPGGGFAIAGEIQRSAMDFQAYLLRTDGDGKVTGGAAFGPRGVTGFTSLAVLDDGTVVAGGSASDRGWLVRVDPALRATWDAPVGDVDDVLGLAALPGGFAMAARRERSTTGFGLTVLTRAVVAGADHHPRWRFQLPTSGRGEPAALTRLSDDSIALVGHHAASDRDRAQIWVARVTGPDQIAWQRMLGSPDEERRGRAIVALPDGGVAVAGDALRDGKRGLRLARLGPDGSVIWERAFGGAGQEVARGLALSGNGFVLVGSTTTKGAGKTNVWILRLDGDGQLIWDRAFGTAG